MLARLSRLVLTVRGTDGVISAVNFYNQCIGLQIRRVTDDWAELVVPVYNNSFLKKKKKNNSEDPKSDDDYAIEPSIILTIKAIRGTESSMSVGYSPIITFQLDPDTMDTTIASCVQAGGYLDGPIQYPAYGKIAALRTPQGHMIGFYEPTNTSGNTTG